MGVGATAQMWAAPALLRVPLPRAPTTAHSLEAPPMLRPGAGAEGISSLFLFPFPRLINQSILALRNCQVLLIYRGP